MRSYASACRVDITCCIWLVEGFGVSCGVGKREEFSSFVSTAARCVVLSSSYFLHDVYVLSCHRAKTEMSDCCCVCVSCPSPSRDDRMCMPRHSPVVDGEEERREEEE